ncbi:uncharacterized protein [Palaemon carinicauda]|uniref:uncharacterized protein n=1 Tax=Palaemon carinicauda TaxID=392227 RepID=UPI0035B61B73
MYGKRHHARPEEFKVYRREAEFIGFHLGQESYRPTGDSLSAIRKFPMPPTPTITDIRSWFDFINQFGPFLVAAPIMEPFRDLLKKKKTDKHVFWDTYLQEKFKSVQDTICKLSGNGLAYYDRSSPTVTLIDWSREGIGFVILQQYCSCITTDMPFCCKNGWRIAL